MVFLIADKVGIVKDVTSTIKVNAGNDHRMITCN